MKLPLSKPLPWGTRLGLVGVALMVFLVACQEAPSADLSPVAADAAGAPKVSALVPSKVSPAGGEVVVIHGEGFKAGQVIWIGQSVVRTSEASAKGDTLTFTTPVTRAGASMDLGVGTLGEDGEPSLRAVLARGYSTGGISSGEVAFLALCIAALALLGTPLFIIIAATTCLGLYLETQLKADLGFFTSGDSAGAGATLFVSWLAPMGDSPLFIAIPLFTFAGTLMSESKAPTRLINLCRAFLGWLPGGLALVTLITCCFFTAFTGASGVTIIALGGLLFPILLSEKYPERFSLGLLTTGGSLGLLFVPSLPVIVYGLVARVEVGRLFQAAVVPGAILVFFLFATSVVVAIVAKVPRHDFDPAEVTKALRGAIWELPLPFIVVGGIYRGYMTAAEASAVTAFYVIVTTVVIYRDIRPRELFGVVRRTSVLVGAILLIMGTALGFTDWLTLEEIPQKILAAMQEHIHDRVTFLVMLNIFLLIVGCLMDIFSATLVVVPLIAPVAKEFGVDPYHLAVIFLVNLEIGYSTPPVGINLFIASLRFRRPVFALYRASVLFIGVMLVALMLITYVPAISLGFFSEMPSMELLDSSEQPAPKHLTVKLGDGIELSVRMSVGGVSLSQAKARRATALKTLQGEEQRLGLSYDDLDEKVRLALEALAAARKAGGDLTSAKDAYAQALEARTPLDPAAGLLEVARKLVDEIHTLEAKVRWRSRLDGTTRTGKTFSTDRLGPGTHLLAATAEDKRRHVVQMVVVVTVEADGTTPDGSGDTSSEGAPDAPDGDWGDDGGWGDDAGGEKKPAEKRGAADDDWGDDGDWGDE